MSSEHTDSNNCFDLQKLEEYNRSENTNQWLKNSCEEVDINNPYNLVDLSKICDPVENIDIYRINHANELFKGIRQQQKSSATFTEMDNTDQEREENVLQNDQCAVGDDLERFKEEKRNKDCSDTEESESGELRRCLEEFAQEPAGSIITPLSVPNFFDSTHNAPLTKPRRQWTLSDLVVFPNEQEPCNYNNIYYNVSHDELHTMFDVVDEEASQRVKELQGNTSTSTECSSAPEREESFQSSDKGELSLVRGELFQSLCTGKVEFNVPTHVGRGRGQIIGPCDFQPSNTASRDSGLFGGRGVVTAHQKSPRGACTVSGKYPFGIKGKKIDAPPYFKSLDSSTSTQRSLYTDTINNNITLRSGFNEDLPSPSGMGRGCDFLNENKSTSLQNSREYFKSPRKSDPSFKEYEDVGIGRGGNIDNGNFKTQEQSCINKRVSYQKLGQYLGNPIVAGRGMDHKLSQESFHSKSPGNNGFELNKKDTTQFGNHNQGNSSSKNVNTGNQSSTRISPKQPGTGQSSPSRPIGQSRRPVGLGRGAMLKFILERNNANLGL